MKTKLIVLSLLIIYSCNVEKKVDTKAWDSLTKEFVEVEIHGFENELTKIDGKGYGQGLILKRQSAVQSLDSLINLFNAKEVEIIESFSEGAAIFYSMDIKIEEKEFLYKHFGDEKSLNEWTNPNFKSDILYICEEKTFKRAFSIDKILNYNKIIFENGNSNLIETCIKFEVSLR